MGQTLNEPITIKETNSCADSNYKVGSSSMQGWRINMEDAHTHFLSLPEDYTAAFFAVYDGHGGFKVSQYASLHLHKRVVNNHHYAEGNPVEAIKRGFLELDQQMLEDDETKDEMSGTTAITVLIKNSTIYCGNVGDSRAVASVKGNAVPLSFDHKPANEEESRRICAAGGWVDFNRVNGNLALSRALGDFVFKKNLNKSPEEQIVTAFPEVHKFDITPDFEFLVLACDGIWDVMSNQEVVTFCRERLCKEKEPQIICEELLERCLAPDCELSGLGCDNMTVILVCLLNNKPFNEWVKILQEKPLETFKNCVIDTEVEIPDEHFTTPSQSPKDSRFLDSISNEKAKHIDLKIEEIPNLLDDIVTSASEFKNNNFDINQKKTKTALSSKQDKIEPKIIRDLENTQKQSDL